MKSSLDKLKGLLDDAIQVLVVMSDDKTSDHIRLSLAKDQYGHFEIATTSNMQAALEFISIQKVDVVIFDLDLPDAQGITCVDELLSWAPNSSLMVITQKTNENLAMDAIGMGADEFLIKEELEQIDVSRSVRYAFERKKSINKLNEAEEKYRTIFENSAVAILVNDKKGRILSWNERAENLLAMKKDELELKPIRFLFTESEWKRISKHEFVQDGAQKSIETKIVSKDGHEHDIDMSIGAWKDSAGKVTGTVNILRDITEQKKAVRELKMAEKQYRTIFDHSAVAIMMTDSNQNIISWNQQAASLLEKGKEELYLKPISSIYPEGEWKMIQAKEIEKSGFEDHIETRVLSSSGEKDVELSVTVLKDESGKVNGSIGILREITERAMVEAALYKAKEKAESANKAKSDFLANMSHEMRTPMNAIIGFSKLLQDNQMTDTQKDYLKTIIDSGEHLLSLINDILDISKIEAKKLEFENIEFDLKDLAASVLKIAEAKLTTDQVVMKIDYDEALPRGFIGDPTRLRQVILNLLGNAAKFTQKGSVTLIVSPGENHSSNGDSDKFDLKFIIRDTGIGIPKDKISQIFSAFSQADSSVNRKFGGTGLGLTISKYIVEMNGGKMWVESEVGKGSDFCFTIKLKSLGEEKDELTQESTTNGSESPSQASAEQENESSQSLENVNVLVAEDNMVNQKLMKILLKKIGCKAVFANNGEEACKSLQESKYDLCLMDLQMPVMGGMEATKKIRSDINKEMPIIALTADVLEGQKQECMSIGMNDFLAKPVNPEKLKNVIERWSKVKKFSS